MSVLSNTPSSQLAASGAAALLGMSPTAFANLRRRYDMALDPITNAPVRLPTFSSAGQRAAFYASHVVVCPALQGVKIPGTVWRFNRLHIERLREEGTAGLAAAFTRD